MIKLTYLHWNDRTRESTIYVNPALIISLQRRELPSRDEKSMIESTDIAFHGMNYNVKETPEEILHLIREQKNR